MAEVFQQIYDPVGGALTEAAVRSLAWRGRLLAVGFAQGEIPQIPANLLLLKGASAVGVFWGDFAKREPQANAKMLAELFGWLAQGRLQPSVPGCRVHRHGRPGGRRRLARRMEARAVPQEPGSAREPFKF